MAKPAFDPSKPFQAAVKSEKPAFDPDKPFQAAPSELMSGTHGLAAGATFGLDDELGAMGSTALKTITGTGNFDSWEDVVQNYRKERDANRAEKELVETTNPKSYIAGNLAGAIVSPMSSLGTGAKGTESAAKLSRLKELGQTAKAAAKVGAIQGGVIGFGDSQSDLTKGEIGGAIKDTVKGAAIGGVVGGAVPVAIEGAKEAAKMGANAAQFAGKKMFSTLFGVSEKNASKYLANRAEINAAPELATIKDGVDDAVSNIKAAMDEGKINIEEAKLAYSELKTQIRNNLTDAKVDAREALRRSEEMLKESAAKAIQPLKDIRPPTDRAADVTAMVGELKNKVINKSGDALGVLDNSGESVDLINAIRKTKDLSKELRENGTLEGRAMSARLDDYIENLKRTVIEKEQEALNIPKPVKSSSAAADFEFGENAPKAFDHTKVRPTGKTGGPTQNLDRVSSKHLKANLEHGHNPDTGFEFDVEEAKRVLGSRGDKSADKLVKEYEKEMASRAAGMPEPEIMAGDYVVPASKAKKLIQGLDPLSNYDHTAGAFDKGLSKAYKSIRQTIDQDLKNTVPAYREKMVDVARDADLLSRADSAFGAPEIAVGKLGRMNTPRGEFDRSVLAELEQAVGRPGAITKDVDLYTKAQAILKDPKRIEEMRRSLPEYTTYRQAMAKLAKMRPDWTRDQLERALSTSKEARALSKFENALEKAKEEFAPIAKLSKDTTEAKLKTFITPSGAPIETRRALEMLEQKSGKKFIKDIENRAVLESFNKPYANGTRNTAFGAIMGGLFGGGWGAGIGATYGQLVDRYGPRMGKAVLDGLGKLRESPRLQTIRDLSLPQDIKNEIEREFKIYMVLKGAGQGEQGLRGIAATSGSPEREPSQEKGEKLWARNGLEKIGINDPQVASAMLSNKAVKALLVEASDLPENSKRLQAIKKKLSQGEVK